MKRIISLALITILLLCCCFSLFGCTNEDVIKIDGNKYKKIKLTTTNYINYIAINSFIVDQNIELVELSNYGSFYDMSCVINITTNRRTNCFFENVKIEYQHNPATWLNSSRTQTVIVSFDGDSCASLVFTEQNVKINRTTEYLTKTDGIVKSIEGYVLVPVE